MSARLISSIISILERPAPAGAARLEPPTRDEHDAYYSRYIDRVPEGDFLAILRHQIEEVATLFGAITAAQADSAYAPGKWTLKEVLGHMIDTERVFAYRAVSIGRCDPAALPGFEQDEWVAPAEFGRRPLDHLLAEWVVVRASTILLVQGLPAEAPMRRGVASGKEISVRALLYVLPGHVDHHLAVVRDRYLQEAFPND